MKKRYEEPVAVLEEFRIEDVVTASTGGDNTGEGGTEIVNPFGVNSIG